MINSFKNPAIMRILRTTERHGAGWREQNFIPHSETFTMMVLNKILGEEEREFLNPGEMERSLICELGNIMCGSYINALASVMDLKLEVSVPDVCIDMGGAILSVPLSRFLRVSDDILMIDNLFHLGGESFLGRILFIPEPDSLDMMLRSLRE